MGVICLIDSIACFNTVTATIPSAIHLMSGSHNDNALVPFRVKINQGSDGENYLGMDGEADVF